MTLERTLRVNQLIKKELGQMMIKEVDMPEGALVTLTRVETASNLIQSRVYISVLPREEVQNVLEILKKTTYDLQQKLNERLKMRPTPKIIFIEEKQTAEAGRVEELIEKIHQHNV